MKKLEYKIEIYSNMTECKNELVNTIKIITQNIINIDFDVCTLNREYQLCTPFKDTIK